MELLKNERAKLKEACKSLAHTLCEHGYITEKQWLDIKYRIDTGDRTAYADVEELLIGIAEKVNSVTY